jgi:hypothetical protein
MCTVSGRKFCSQFKRDLSRAAKTTASNYVKYLISANINDDF